MLLAGAALAKRDAFRRTIPPISSLGLTLAASLFLVFVILLMYQVTVAERQTRAHLCRVTAERTIKNEY
jgi:hypothetical protein